MLFVEALGVGRAELVPGRSSSTASTCPWPASTRTRCPSPRRSAGVVFGLYFALCGVVALLVALRDRAPGRLRPHPADQRGRGARLLGAFAWGLVGWGAFVFMMVVLGLIVLILMTYDRLEGPSGASPEPPRQGPGAGRPADGPQDVLIVRFRSAS